MSGVDEKLPGPRAQGFNGTMFVTAETLANIYPMHDTRSIVQILWQQNGLHLEHGTRVLRRLLHPGVHRRRHPWRRVDHDVHRDDGDRGRDHAGDRNLE